MPRPPRQADSPYRACVAPAALGLLTLAAVLARSPSAGAGPVALVFPPWWNAARAVAAASAVGAVIRLGGVPFVTVVAPSTPGARAAYRRAGAWLLLDPVLAGGCLRNPR